MNKTIREAFKASIPVLMGYEVLGIAFGMLLTSKGFGVGYAFIMSVFIFAGSMQFVGVELLSSGASLISAALMTLIINARHLVYGLSMIKKYKGTGKLKPYLIFALTDETYSLLVSPTPEGVDEKMYMFYVSFFDQCYWVTGSLIGAICGSLIKINTTGLDFSMTALFIVIVTEQFLSTKDHKYTYLGFVISIGCLIAFGSSNFLIPSIIGIIIGLLILMKIEGGKSNA